MARATTTRKKAAEEKKRAPSKSKAEEKPKAKKEEPKEKPKKSTKRTREEAEAAPEPAAKEPEHEEVKEAPAKRRRVVAAKAPKPAPKPVSLFPGQPSLDLFMFGTNSFGALGLGDPEQADDPDTRSQIPRPKQPISGTLKFVQVVCGGMHTVGLTPDGDVYTWGVNDEGALGRKTSGTCWEKEPEKNKSDSFVPGQAHLPDGVKAVQVAAGDGFTFAIGTDGCLYGCGHFKDEVGALSGFTPEVKMQGLFTLVWKPESLRDRIKKLACGARHAALLTNRGDVLTWGSGSQGQLGRVKHYHQDSEFQPTAEQLFRPTSVGQPLLYALGSSPAVDISCGAYSTFVINKNGDVAAMGLNNSGQLGIAKENNDDNIKWEPVSVDSLSHVAHIAGGEQHTLALTKKGVLLSFGAGTYGMLGRRSVNITTANEIHPEPTPVDGLEGLKVEAIAAGTNVSACTTADGDAYFWGSNTNLQLAKGTDEEDEPVPKKMGRVKVFGYRKIHTVCFGGQHGALLAGALPDAAAPAAGAAAGGSAAAAAGGSGAGPSGAPAAAPPAPAAKAPAEAKVEEPKANGDAAGEKKAAGAAMEVDAKEGDKGAEEGDKGAKEEGDKKEGEEDKGKGDEEEKGGSGEEEKKAEGDGMKE